MAALCWARQTEIIDGLVDLLITLVHKVDFSAERKVGGEMLDDLRRRTGAGEARRSDGYSRAARARQASTSFSADLVNSSAGRPMAFTRASFSVSTTSVSMLRLPGSAFSSARKPASPVCSSSLSATRASNPATAFAVRREATSVVNRRSAAARAVPRTRSSRLDAGGSMRSTRHRATSASRNRSSDSSTGQTSSASHAASLSSSPTVASRNPRALRIWARWYLTARPAQS